MTSTAGHHGRTYSFQRAGESSTSGRRLLLAASGKDRARPVSEREVRGQRPAPLFSTESGPVSTLAHTLVGRGNMVGCGPHAAVQNDRHPARLFAVIVGETSKARKGTGASAPRELCARVDPAWAANRVRSGLSTGEGL